MASILDLLDLCCGEPDLITHGACHFFKLAIAVEGGVRVARVTNLLNQLDRVLSQMVVDNFLHADQLLPR